jgi:hypothetical protein
MVLDVTFVLWLKGDRQCYYLLDQTRAKTGPGPYAARDLIQYVPRNHAQIT